MEKDRQTKIIAIVALFIGVATLTLGFAAFSARLIIQSKATVTPDADSFKVVLSKEQNSEVVGTVTPSGNGADATISNASEPTISGLKANFVNPGEKVVYEFYAVNTGDLDAFLNKIEYANVSSGTENKVCTAGEGTTNSYVQSACNSIRVTVKVGNDDTACQTSTYATHSLARNTGEKVVVTIEYNKEGARADGPFEVQFGNITLNYSTVDTETKNVPVCDEYVSSIASKLDINGRTNIIDNDNDGKISLSDKITLGTESFYVMSTDEAAGTVTKLAEWNLNVGSNLASGEAGMQNSACKGWSQVAQDAGGTYYCTVAFSSTNYWSSSVSTYPAWVYDNNDIIRNYVNTYVDKLKAAGYSTVIGRLIRNEELLTLGCQFDGGGGGECNSAPSWVKNTTYWSGSAYNSTYVWHVNTNGDFIGQRAYSLSDVHGLRPVITIKASEI